MSKIVKKGWGQEVIFASNNKYAGKLLEFKKKGAKFSMHFHASKTETWYVLKGSFSLRTIDTLTGSINEITMYPGDVWTNAPLKPHQLQSLEANSTIIEVSTADTVADNYRVMPGDSQA